jgi:hypothetical protein
MTELGEALKQQLETMVEELRNNINSVTGKTAREIESTIDEKEIAGTLNLKGEILAPLQLVVKETGRGPTKTTVAGSPTLQEKLYSWIKSAGIYPDDPKMTQEQLSWAMANKMHRDGDDLFSSPPSGYKKSGVISDVINDQRIDAFLGTFMDKVGEVAIKTFKDRVRK